MRYRVIVFDFDGTLVDSNDLKRQGFYHALADRAECVDALPETLAALNGQSRHEIIGSLVGRIASLSPAERLLETERRTMAYGAWVEERILRRMSESPAGSLLPRWQSGASLYVCSMTPTDSLRRLLQQAGWLSYFHGLEGYPVDKGDMLARTASRHGVGPDETLMVGDGAGDEAAAAAAGTAFFHIRGVNDLRRLDAHLFA